MKTAAQMLQAKPDRTVHAIAPDASVYDAIAMMADKRVGALLVMRGDEIVGIVTERDFMRRLIARDLDPKRTSLGEIMTTDLKVAKPEDELLDWLRQMSNDRFRHVPVVEGGQLIGVVSIGDVVKSRITQLEFERDQLDNYVHQT